MIFGGFGKLAEVRPKFEEISPVFEEVEKSFDFVVGLFGDDEEGDCVVGTDIFEAIDVGSDEFEDEHEIVPFVEVNLLVLLNFFIFLDKLIHVHLLRGLDNDLFLAFLLFHLFLLGVDVVLIDLDVFFVELLVLAHI